jgi:hypothetical protein
MNRPEEIWLQKDFGGCMRDARRWAVLALLICMIYAGKNLLAQSMNAGDIRGTVTDASGAVVPAAKVTVLNVDTGVVKEITTDSAGVYDTGSIVVGNYTVSFTMSGFDQLVRGPITLQVGYTTVNGELKIGSISQKVVVNTDVPLLKTESGDQTTTLGAKDMANLPNIASSNGPDWENFMILLPGATGTPPSNSSSAGSSNPGQEVSTNGNMPFNNVLADGASTTLPSSQNANPAVFEDVDELQVSLSSFSAQYGVGGLIINQITKGGASQFHGSGYEYFQNDALNAANYGFGNKETVPFLRYNNFGGTISGPVALLGLRKKAFFFFGYDQIINNTVNASYQTVPTPAIMGGDFTGSYPLYDPTTQTIGTDSKGNPYPIRKSFLSEYGSNAIPASLIDAVSAKFQQFYPTASNHIPFGHFVAGNLLTTGVLQNNFYSQVPQPRPWRRYFGRLDYDITPTNRLTMSDTQGDEIENGDNSVTACPIGCQLGDVDNNNAQVTDVWNISSRTINEARMGYTSQLNFFSDQGTNTGLPGKLGWQFAKANVLPAVQFQRNYPYAWIQPATNAQYKEFVFDPSDVVTMIRGKHILHFGGEFAFYRDDATPWGNINAGTLQFDGVYTENWTLNAQGVASPNTSSGEEYADFLLGLAQNWNAAITPEYGARLKKPQMFIQDDIKLNPNLTVNLGVRYEISHGFNEIRGNEATFDPKVTNPANNAPGAFWYGSTHANGRDSLQADVYTTVLPRVGASWLIRPDTTVRGGFGLYSYNFSLDNYGTGMGGAVSSSGTSNDQSNGIYPTVKFDGSGNIYGTGTPLPYSAASTDPTRFNGQGVGFNDYHTPIPKIWQWNFGFERQLGTNFVGTLTYVGSHGFNLTFPTDINAVPEDKLSSNDTQFRPYPIYQNIGGGSGGNLYQAISNYNSLQATINKRFTNGLSFSFNYVWSHMLDDQDSSGWGSHSGPQNYQHSSSLTLNQTSLNYGPSNFDVRNAFKGYAVYQLPFGQGKMFLNQNRLLDEVIGGWQVSGTIVESTGNPFQVFADGNTYTHAGSQFPNRNSAVSIRPLGGRTTGEWYNPAAFSAPGNGNFGTLGRNPLVGPGLNYVNLSGGKTFTLKPERVQLQIHCDASNAFNHPSFAAPNGTLATPDATGAYTGPTTGQISSLSVNGRSVQLGARLSF